MRFIFIHGFGETPAVFDQLIAVLPGDHLCIDLWTALGQQKRPELQILDFCQELIQQYEIKSDDVIVGHSLGGKLAHHIKHLQGNTVIQIASWTNQEKAILPIDSPSLLLWLAKNGFMFTNLTKKYLLSKYHRPETKAYYEEAFDHLIKGPKNCSVNQFRLILEPISEDILVMPDLRIHAKRDNIARYPDESFHEVPGDHFCLITHPKEVSAAIKTIL